ncbi:tRNA (adenosine(37)-N6)-threonylcarbamoyltransferase complex ATPase subunit type 1 TsaE [Mesonia aestuariivivens]|uniref:tRNA (Adenosine(37)-N6)-threonylcarbamoyltransferase complex ATPase subunit type 1 TsaE n=1 Tax=Mesonia aestuariivivens TaxID=2796128 RepID=A0ABS6W4H9_9FLAO|nr:tRNA (adenosine(37)-N6)-threonylcarbamoyltransferase complex ATPase subunit type 1 TsaE [Mesonia aestuariivivens]MBW2962776.1 tRNA (adenosine(37)-N6)-threonylcarbamoyltransferase complex ATPase subunit type 1 TsaE [Mesonia aestuariivivens]
MEIEYNIDQLPEVAKQILKVSSCKTLLFYGEMGAGKTTLIKEIVKQLNSTDRVTSPTYSLVNEYVTPTKKIYHFDFHRIEDEDEAYDIGFEDYLMNDDWVLIEWPDKIKNLIPEMHTKISILKNSYQARKISIDNENQSVKTQN